MKLPSRPPVAQLGVTGLARVGQPTRSLIPRLNQGEIAVIDHRDLDSPTATAMVRAGVVAVVNAQPMISGRYANLGPQVLIDAGVVVVESIGESLFARLADNPGALRIHDGEIYAGETLLGAGVEVHADTVRAQMAAAETGLAVHVETFTRNSAQLIARDLSLLLDGAGLPVMPANLAHRPALVVGQAHPAEVVHLRSFARNERPVVIAVDAAADRLRAHRIHADVVVISDADRLPATRILKNASAIVVVTRPDGSASPRHAIHRTGVEAQFISTHVSGDDVALLLARRLDASVVVGAGMPASLADFLDQQRPGLAGSFLARLALGGRYVDAEAVPMLHTGRVRPWHLGLLAALGVTAVLSSVAATPVGQEWFDAVQGWF